MRRTAILAALLVGLPLSVATAAPARTARPAPVPSDIPVALLIDLSSSQTLFAREAGRRLMPASITKVMTAFTAFTLIEEGKLSETAHVRISEQLEEEWSGEGSSMFLLEGETPTVRDLLLGTTTVSGNDATVALARAATGSLANWAALMNANAARLGMHNSHFSSPNGFPDGGQTYTTARDLALLGEAMTTRHAALYRRYFGHRTFKWRDLTQANHDPITGRVAGADGLKTGFTNEAGYTFLGSAERDGRRLVMVLGAAPTSRIRDQAARDLIEWGFAEFESHGIFGAGTLVGEALVQNGNAGTVMLRTARPVSVTMPRGIQGEPSLSIRYRGPVSAPVEEGERIAVLRIEIAGLDPVEVPLEAAETVARADVWHRLVNGLYGILG